jgi:thioredoxin reductase
MSERLHDLLVVGAGPAGLECALAARHRGFEVLVLEAGRVGENVASWGFVELFTPWGMNTTPRGLAECTQAMEASAAHDGHSFVRRYLQPIADCESLRGRVREGVRVRWIGRAATTKSELIADLRRAKLPFIVLAQDASGAELSFRARAVVDASGVLQRPRWLGDGGIPALGERACEASIARRVEPLPADAVDGRRFAVVGAGFSAATMLEQFVRLREQGAACEVDWCVGGDAELPLAPIAADPLPARARLAQLAVQLALGSDPGIRSHRGVRVAALTREGGRVLLHTSKAPLGPFDRVFAMVGYAPDLSLSAELQFHACYATEGPMRLAAQLLAQAGSGDCLQLDGGDAESLRNPEPGFFVIGAKSYGRNPDFLLRNLPAQIEAVLAMIVRDRLGQ